jgi:hypothetical protein
LCGNSKLQKRGGFGYPLIFLSDNSDIIPMFTTLTG